MLNFLKSTRTSRWVRVGVWMGLVLVAGMPGVHAQGEATWGGRPFVRIARANTTDAAFGFLQGFGRSQLVGDEVVVPILGPGFETVGLARGRGGPLSVVARTGTPGPSGGTLLRFHDGLARETAGDADASFVFAAGVSLADGLLLADAGGFRSLLASGTVLPNSNGRVANRLGEPHWAGGKLVVIAWNQGAAGVEFRGVYRVVDGALEAIADTATALPGVVGVPDGLSSQVGFDGTTVAFWATRGPFAAVQGIFRSSGGAVSAVASTGDPLPGGGTISGFRSPPVVEDGVVWFFAQDAARAGYLLRGGSDGSISVVAKDGDVAPEGGVLTGIGDTGLEVSGGQVMFGARTGSGPGVYSVDGGILRAVIPGGGIVAGARPSSVALMDLEGDTLVLLITVPGAQPASVVANLARPMVPVIVTPLQGGSVAAGARLELRVAAAGEPPLQYLWWGPRGRMMDVTGDTYVVPAAGAVDVGYYSVQVTNAFGLASAPSALVNVEIAPEILEQPLPVTVETGDAVVIRMTAMGGLPMQYTWWKDGAQVPMATPSQGVLSLVSASPADAGLYWAVITNAFGTATSESVRLTVLPSGPNPSYGGRRFVAPVQSGAEAPGAGVPFLAGGFNEGTARWWLDQLLFAGTGPEYRSLGLFGAGTNGLSALVGLGMALPNGLGTLDGVRLISGLADSDAPTFFGSSNGVPVGIFRWEGGQIRSLVDWASPVPGAAGEFFRPFYSVAMQAGLGLAFLGQTELRSGVYVQRDGELRRLLDTRMDLPVLGTAAAHLQSLGYDGEVTAVLAANANQSAQAILRIDAGGAITAIAQPGDRIPGTEKAIRLLGPVQVSEGSVRFFAFDAAFARYALSWRDGVLKTLAAPGDIVEGLGTLTSVDSSTLHATAGKVFLSGRVRLPTGAVNAVFAVTDDGLKPVFSATKLDGRRINIVSLVEARGDRVVMSVQFGDGGAGYYVNTEAAGEASARLDFVRVPGVGLRLTVPEGFGLEATEVMGGTWAPVPGLGSVEVPTSEGARFLRLKRANAP